MDDLWGMIWPTVAFVLVLMLIVAALAYWWIWVPIVAAGYGIYWYRTKRHHW